MSTGPNCVVASAINASMSATALASASCATAGCPTAEMLPAVCSARTRSMSPTTTLAPAIASAVASARPIPDPPPVTTATLPSISTFTSERPKPGRQFTFRLIGAQHCRAVRPGQHSACHRIRLVERDAVDLRERLADAAVRAVIELAAADPVHPGPGILQTQNQTPAQRTLGNAAFVGGDAISRNCLKNVGGHLHDITEPLRQARRVHRKRAGVSERVDGGIHRVRQPALLTDLLEQPRT